MEKNGKKNNLNNNTVSSVVRKKSSSVVRKKKNSNWKEESKEESSSSVIKKVSKKPSSSMVNQPSTVVKRRKSSSEKNSDRSSKVTDDQEPVKSKVVIRKKISTEKKKDDQKLEQNILSDQKTTEKKKTRKEKKQKTEHPRKKTSSKKKKILIICLTVLILLLVVASYLFFFPFKLTYDTKGDLVTKTGTLDFEVTITGNKPISKIYYAVDPEEENNLDCYTTIDSDGGLFQNKILFDDLSIPVGSRTLILYVESLLGTHEIISIPVEYTIGYINPLSIEDVVIGPTDNTYIVDKELLITFDDNVSEAEAKKLIEKYQGKIVGEIYFLKQYQVKFEVEDLSDLKRKLEAEEIISNVTYNYFDEVEIARNKVGSILGEEIHFTKDYYISALGIDEAYELVKKPHWINVGLIDSPVDYRHNDLNMNESNMFIPSMKNSDFDDIDNILDYYDTYDHENDEVYNQDKWYSDCSFLSFRSHGTHVAGIMAGIRDDNGVEGINDRVSLYYASMWVYYKRSAFIDSVDEASREDYIAQFDGDFGYGYDSFNMTYALSNLIMSDVRVINMSVGFDSVSDSSYNELKKYYDTYFATIEKTGKDFLIVKSAGNCSASGQCKQNADNDYFNRILSENEFADNHSLIVGGSIEPGTVTANDLIHNYFVHSKGVYSKYGEIVDIFAPGTIYSSIYNNDYEWMMGTSQAAPIVSGTASLIYSINPDFTASQVIDFIVDNPDGYVSFEKVKKGVINTKSAVEAALTYQETGEKTTTIDDTKYGFIQGSIQDAVTKEPVEVAGSIEFIDVNDPDKIYIAADTNARYLNGGNYDYILPVGTYNMVIKFEGYVKETIYHLVIDEDTVTYNILLNVVNDSDLTVVSTTGYAIDAFDGSHIPNTKIEIYKGISNNTENKITEVQADANGYYTLLLEPGNYTAYASAEGYTSSKTNILVVPNKNGEQDCTLTPVLKEGEIRAVLTWGLTPRDLDSHLVGPTPDGNRFHIYFSNKNYEYQGTKYNNLDLDDTTSYGPETTSVYVGVNGTYTYYVHDFTNRNSSSSNALSLSGAQVKLYIAGREEPIIYNVPNQPGNLWKVFSIENGQVTSINEMSFHSNYRNLE